LERLRVILRKQRESEKRKRELSNSASHHWKPFWHFCHQLKLPHRGRKSEEIHICLKTNGFDQLFIIVWTLWGFDSRICSWSGCWLCSSVRGWLETLCPWTGSTKIPTWWRW
jgi:hypothetical protein